MKLDLQAYKTIDAKIKNVAYPITVSGCGKPCLVIGIGTLMMRTLSQKFKTIYEVYSSDLYWDSRYKQTNTKPMTMQQILDDIAELAENLKLSSYTLFAHSAYGIVALEFAKQHPPSLAGVIMVGTPLNSNSEVAADNNQCFELNADPNRKKIDLERQIKFSKKNLEKLDPTTQFLQTYIHRDAPRYWHDPSFDCTPLWEGIPINTELLNHFFSTVLPKCDVRIGLENIDCPVFLAAGMSDFDCCPWVWSEIHNPPTKLIVSKFEKSGHYPHYEEASLFDERIHAWL